jgi:predicted dehydrogenase
LDDDAIGEIKLVTSTFCFRPERDPDDRKFAHDLAGGSLLDLGVYNISLSQWAIRANPLSVSAVGFVGETGVDELTAVTMVYAGNVVSQFACSLLFDGVNDLTIYGTRGNVRIHPKFWQSTGATLTTTDGKVAVDLPFRSHGFEYQIEEAIRCIREGRIESDRMPLEDSLSTMRVMDTIREQIRLRYAFE